MTSIYSTNSVFLKQFGNDSFDQKLRVCKKEPKNLVLATKVSPDRLPSISKTRITCARHFLDSPLSAGDTHLKAYLLESLF